MARPQQNEFEFSDGSITHKPTGHRLSFLPGSLAKGHFEQGHEPRVLEFDEESVRRMAKRLWIKRHQDAIINAPSQE
jgi:hypothetical protein